MEKIKAVVVEAGKPARIEEVENSLQGYYKTIGCKIIEVAYPFDSDICVILDEEGKLDGAPMNRIIKDGDGNLADVYYGTMVIVGYTEKGEWRGLTDEEAEEFRKLYEEPDEESEILKQIILSQWFFA